MIAQMWRGWSSSWDADSCGAHLLQTAIRPARGSRGNRAAYLLRRGEEDRTEFAVLTLWESLEDLRNFAGEDLEEATPYPRENKYLIDSDAVITHYGVTDPGEE